MMKNRLLYILFSVVMILILSFVWWNMPVKFLQDVQEGEVSCVEVLNSGTGNRFTVRDSRDISRLVNHIRNQSLRKSGVLFGYGSAAFELSFYDGRGRLVEELAVGCFNTIRKAPFVYRVETERLCVGYLAHLEGELAQ